MSSKINSVLLIDDSDADNDFHTFVIKKSGIVNVIDAVEGGEEALEFLAASAAINPPKPDLIFLDINMPAMDGWEFLEEYDKLDDSQKARIILVMLSTSLNPDDREKAEAHPDIEGFVEKPLTVDVVNSIASKYF